MSASEQVEPTDTEILLRQELISLADELGVQEATREAIKTNWKKHADNPEAHLTYLRSQITRARNALEARG